MEKIVTEIKDLNSYEQADNIIEKLSELKVFEKATILKLITIDKKSAIEPQESDTVGYFFGRIEFERDKYFLKIERYLTGEIHNEIGPVFAKIHDENFEDLLIRVILGLKEKEILEISKYACLGKKQSVEEQDFKKAGFFRDIEQLLLKTVKK